MATAEVLAEHSCSEKSELPVVDSRRDGQEQDESNPSASRPVVERAMEDPGLLTPMEMECLVRVLCAKVARDTGIGKFIADFCVSVMSKQRGRAFAGLMMTSIHQWFAWRAELLPRRIRHFPEGKADEEPRYKWTAFVDFLAQLLAAMTGAGWGTAYHKSLWLVSSVAVLLCDCCDIMLRLPALDVLDEVKCLHSSLVIAGKAAQSAAAQQVEDLMVLMRRASNNPEFPPEAQQVLLELVKLHATGWED